MPSDTVKSFAKRSGKSIPTIEKYWDEANIVVTKTYPDVEPDSDRFFALVTAIVKRMAGIEDKKVETMVDNTYKTDEMIIRESLKDVNINPFVERANILFTNKERFIKVIEDVTKADVEQIKRNSDKSFYILTDDGKNHTSKINTIQFIYGGYMRNKPIYTTEYIKKGLHELKFNTKVIIK
jgi:predicted transcriptional regulator